MGAPESGMQAGEQPAAEELLGAFKRIDAADRRRHETVLNYWLSIRGDKEFPPLHDLDPLELSDAAPSSLLLELISGGHDAEVRHCGEALKGHVDAERQSLTVISSGTSCPRLEYSTNTLPSGSSMRPIPRCCRASPRSCRSSRSPATSLPLKMNIRARKGRHAAG